MEGVMGEIHKKVEDFFSEEGHRPNRVFIDRRTDLLLMNEIFNNVTVPQAVRDSIMLHGSLFGRGEIVRCFGAYVILSPEAGISVGYEEDKDG